MRTHINVFALLALGVVFLFSGATYADTSRTEYRKTWLVTDSSGDCQCTGDLTLYPDGTWNFSGWAYSSDSGDEYNIVFDFNNSADQDLFEVNGYKDIAVEKEWVRWEQSGTFPAGHYGAAYYLRTRSDC